MPCFGLLYFPGLVQPGCIAFQPTLAMPSLWAVWLDVRAGSGVGGWVAAFVGAWAGAWVGAW
eukprot:14654516-Alexandrium_andersonii.AAC.1